jgi:hypothetical protein
MEAFFYPVSSCQAGKFDYHFAACLKHVERDVQGNQEQRMCKIQRCFLRLRIRSLSIGSTNGRNLYLLVGSPRLGTTTSSTLQPFFLIPYQHVHCSWLLSHPSHAILNPPIRSYLARQPRQFQIRLGWKTLNLSLLTMAGALWIHPKSC